MMSGEKNTREFTRIPLQRPAELLVEGQVIVRCMTRDLSLNGVYLDAPTPLKVGTECRLTIAFGDTAEAGSVTVNGHIARSEGEGTAIAFVAIKLEDYHRLRELVLYNAPDTQRVENEFNSHLGLHAKKSPSTG